MSGRGLHFIVEGQTEEDFVKHVLVPHLSQFSVFGYVRCVMTARRRRVIHRGGLVSYEMARKDICLWIKEDQNADAAFTTMFDLYGLPDNFPAYSQARENNNPREQVAILEKAMYDDINDQRFLPYLQLHEFEALVLADPAKLRCLFLDNESGIDTLVKMVGNFESPEMINDDNNPCKRIMAQIPEYGGEKAFAGPVVVERIGLPLLRQKCPHFDEWLGKLEKLAEANDL